MTVWASGEYSLVMTKVSDDQPVTYGLFKSELRQALSETESNIAELIGDLMTHIDRRFDKVERDIKGLKKTVLRIDNHEVRLQALERKRAKYPNP